MDAVFEITDTQDPGTKQGTAVLLNTERGLFLTAGHFVLNANSVRLKRGGDEYSFTVVAQGNNSANVLQDWAILRASEGEWAGMMPSQEARVAYYVGDPTFLRNASILTSGTTVSFPAAIRWRAQAQSLPCDTNSVLLLEVPQYDKGNSGAPVYLKDEIKEGVVAIASRFQNSADRLSTTERELVRTFYSLQRKSQSVHTQDDAPFSETTIRTLLKDKVFVKVLPVKCVIDQLISNNLLDVVVGDLQDNIVISFSRSLEYIKSDAPKEKRMERHSQVLNMLESRQFDWIQILYLWKDYYQSYGIRQDRWSMPISAKLTEATARASVDGVQYSFLTDVASIDFTRGAMGIEAMQRWVAQRQQRVAGPGSPANSLIVASFASEQAKSANLTEALNNTDVIALPISPDMALGLGAEWAASLREPSYLASLSQENRALELDLATTLLLQGGKTQLQFQDLLDVDTLFTGIQSSMEVGKIIQPGGTLSGMSGLILEESFRKHWFAMGGKPVFSVDGVLASDLVPLGTLNDDPRELLTSRDDIWLPPT